MFRLLVFIGAVIVIEYLLRWGLTHFGIVILGACSWWMWSLWQGARRA